MDIVIDILLEIYMELMMLIVPEEKRGKKHYRIATVIAVLCMLGIMALGVWGIVWIAEYDNMLGLIPLTFALLLSVAQIVLGVILFIKRNRGNNKQSNQIPTEEELWR